MSGSLFLGLLAAAVATPALSAPQVVRDGQLGDYDLAHRVSVAAGPSNKIFLAASVHMPDQENPLAKVYLWSSANMGESWSSAQKISDSPFDDIGAGLCVTRNGTLLVNYSTSLKWALGGAIKDPRYQAWWDKIKGLSLFEVNNDVNFWMRRSTDGGASWSEPYSLPGNPLAGVTQLAEGGLFLFGHRNTDSIRQMIGGERNNFILTSAISEDDGVTWKKLKDLAVVQGEQLVANALHETGFAENASRQIVVILRNKFAENGSALRQFEVLEGDRTKWSSERKIGEARAFHLAGLRDGRLLVSYTAPEDATGLFARLSQDGGKTWTEADSIVTGDHPIQEGFSSAELADGSFITSWFEKASGGNFQLRYRIWRP